MVFFIYLSQYAKFYKIIQTKVIDLIEIHIFCLKHFFLRVILFEKISDTSDIFDELILTKNRKVLSPQWKTGYWTSMNHPQ